MAAIRIVVRGIVQGVGFRYYALETAMSMGIVGEVWNRGDGSVEVIGQHPDGKVLDAFAEALRDGPGEVKDIVHDLPGDICVLEGGPSLNGQLLAADLVDEVCLTIAPNFVAGRAMRVAEGTFAARDHWQLAHICEDNGFLFLRYLR